MKRARDVGRVAFARVRHTRFAFASRRAFASEDEASSVAADAGSASLAARAARARALGATIGEASSARVQQTIGADGTAPKFYKDVNVRETNGEWEIVLDERALKTPKRATYKFKTKALAIAVASEWAAQGARIAPFTMPLTGLSATAIDHMGDAETRTLHVETLLKHFATDPTRVRSADDAVLKKQKELHDPILAWARREFGPVEVSHSIFGPPGDEKTDAALRKRLHGMCPWELTCAFAICASTKSLLIGLRTIRGEMTVDEAIAAARVEEELQIAEWGLVEGGHDIDQLDIRVRVTAPVLLMKFRAMKDRK